MGTPGTPPEWAVRLRDERKAKVGTVADMARRLKEVAGEQRGRLPGIDDLTRTIRGWERGDHHPSERYRLLYARAGSYSCRPHKRRLILTKELFYA